MLLFDYISMNYKIHILYIALYIFVINVSKAQSEGHLFNGEYSRKISTYAIEHQLYELVPADTVKIAKLINHAIRFLNKNEDSAAYLLTDALAKSRYLKYDEGIAAALCNLGNCSTNLGDYETAIKLYRQGLPYALRGFHNRTSLAMYYTSMSGPFFYLQEYDSMYQYTAKAEDLIADKQAKSKGEARDMASIYNNIGMLWRSAGDFSKTKTNFEKARSVLHAYRMKPDIRPLFAEINGNLGILHAQQDHFDIAIRFFDTALVYDAENANALISLGKILTDKGQTERALQLLKKAVHICEVSRNYIGIANAKCKLGQLYYQQNNYAQAIPLLMDVIERTDLKAEGELEISFHAYTTLSAIKSKTGDYKQAYAYQQKSLEIMDSLMSARKVQQIYEIEMKSRTARKDKEILQKQWLLKTRDTQLKQKNFWMGAIGAGTLLLAVSLISVYRSSRNKQKLQAEQLRSLNQKQELDNFKFMIKGEEQERSRMANELHDGIMVQLSAAKMNMMNLSDSYDDRSNMVYMSMADCEQMIAQLENITTELRRTAHNLMPDMLLQGGLAEAIFYFCNSLQQNTNLIISFQQHGDIPRLQSEFELSVYRIVQELLQNVIKHAHASKVIVQLAQVEEKILAITVEDDGVGFNIAHTTRDSKHAGGMGLKSIRTRVEVLNGAMDISSDPGMGTAVHLEFEMPLAG